MEIIVWLFNNKTTSVLHCHANANCHYLKRGCYFLFTFFVFHTTTFTQFHNHVHHNSLDACNSIISKGATHESLQQRFTTVTCWHFISPHFLRAIALQLSSSFWLPLCSVRLDGQRNCLAHGVVTANSCEGKRSVAVSPRRCCSVERSHHAGNGLPSPFPTWKVKDLFCVFFWVSADVGLERPVRLISTEPSLMWRDQAPHLVYLTSWVGHSVSLSVSLSNTPSEVSLVYKQWPVLGRLHGLTSRLPAALRPADRLRVCVSSWCNLSFVYWIPWKNRNIHLSCDNPNECNEWCNKGYTEIFNQIEVCQFWNVLFQCFYP